MNSRTGEKKIRVAVVEDDADLRETVLEYLRMHGYLAWGASNAEDFFRLLAVNAVDVVVLDIGLPGENGISIARHLQGQRGLAVIIVSARDALDDRLAGLAAGADRYLVKPVNLDELAANIEAACRRPVFHAARPAAEAVHDEKRGAAPWRLVKQGWCLVEPGGDTLNLTAREYLLLKYLFEAQGEIVSKKEVAEKIIGARVYNNSERLDVMLARLRKKCQLKLCQPLPVKTMHQVGYAFTAPAALE